MIFKQTLQKLLCGTVICETAHPDEFEYLQAQSNVERVNDFLANLDRSLTELASAGAWYCTYNQVDDQNTSELTGLFSEVRGYFRPVVEFLELLLIATNSDVPIRAKSVVNINGLFDPFEHDQTLKEQLQRLTSIKPFKTNKTDPREQLVSIFQRLEDMGYFVRKNSGSSRYFATARFDLIYQLIEFLNDSERLELPELEQDPQEQLLF